MKKTRLKNIAFTVPLNIPQQELNPKKQLSKRSSNYKPCGSGKTCPTVDTLVELVTVGLVGSFGEFLWSDKIHCRFYFSSITVCNSMKTRGETKSFYM